MWLTLRKAKIQKKSVSKLSHDTGFPGCDEMHQDPLDGPGLDIDLAKCVVKTAEVDTATEFPCDFCNQVVRFTLSNVVLLQRASSEILQLILSCEFV